MQIKEGEPQPQDVNYQKLISDYKTKGFIRDGSPFWWSTDYAPDPREYMPFDEFMKRLTHLGQSTIVRDFQCNSPWDEEQEEKKDVYLYTMNNVPITIINLEIDGENPQFLVTARPYNKKELSSYSILAKDRPIEELKEAHAHGGAIVLADNFFPHIRGLFAGERGTHFFWYPIQTLLGKENLLGKISKALERNHLSFLNIYTPFRDTRTERTYLELWYELGHKKKLVDMRNPCRTNFATTEVSAEEFLMEDQDSERDLLVFYPLRLPEFKDTLTLIITNRTNKESKIRKPTILGVYAENGTYGYSNRAGILRIKDREFAREISELISADFGTQVDTVLFTPQKGRPKYERISP